MLSAFAFVFTIDTTSPKTLPSVKGELKITPSRTGQSPSDSPSIQADSSSPDIKTVRPTCSYPIFPKIKPSTVLGSRATTSLLFTIRQAAFIFGPFPFLSISSSSNFEQNAALPTRGLPKV